LGPQTRIHEKATAHRDFGQRRRRRRRSHWNSLKIHQCMCVSRLPKKPVENDGPASENSTRKKKKKETLSME